MTQTNRSFHQTLKKLAAQIQIPIQTQINQNKTNTSLSKTHISLPMESDDDFFSFSDTDKPSSPIVPARKLKRLKKATGDTKPSPDPLQDTDLSQELNLFESENLGENDGRDFDDVGKGNELDSEIEGLGVKRALFDDVDKEIELDSGIEGFGVKRALFDDVDKENELDSGIEGLGVKRALGFDDVSGGAEKRRSFDEVEEKQKEKKKKRKVKCGDGDEDKTRLASSNKRREEKERRERIQELRAASQRLLRETTDASFRPVAVVQKPVSSILAKIRQRKREVSERSVFMNRNSSFIEENDSIAKEVELDIDLETSSNHDVDHNGMEKENIDLPVDVERSSDAQDTEESDDIAMQSPASVQTALDSQTKQAFRAPVDDTQDLFFDPQQSDSKDELQDDTPKSPLEEVLAPSVLAMNLKLDSAPLDDFSSDEEDNDKENIDPAVQQSVNLTSSPLGDPVKAFVDEEAEEEDDSDNDLGRFPEIEEEDDNMDSDELNDIIATEYDEKPVDNEMRNELHQKWLEQQDNAGTEDLLQKLKCGTELRERSLCEEEESEDEDGEENETMDYHVSTNVVRMNLKKAKEMLPLMFTDKDDVYVSSDDEETEKRPVTRYIPRKAEEEAKFLSPAEDEGSREIFGLIKKLNGAPDTRKKPKITSSFNMLSIGTKTNISSKSSFLARGSKNSLPSFQKHGSGAARAFIFERDDSNNRSAISMPDDTVEVKENRPRKISAKFSSQNRYSSQVTQTVAETKSGPSLHEILRRPSLKSSYNSPNGMVGQVDAIYASFRLEQKITKKDRDFSIRI